MTSMPAKRCEAARWRRGSELGTDPVLRDRCRCLKSEIRTVPAPRDRCRPACGARYGQRTGGSLFESWSPLRDHPTRKGRELSTLDPQTFASAGEGSKSFLTWEALLDVMEHGHAGVGGKGADRQIKQGVLSETRPAVPSGKPPPGAPWEAVRVSQGVHEGSVEPAGRF